MSSIENLNKLSSSPSSNPSHGTETAETAGSAETAQERNALGAAKTEAGLEPHTLSFLSSIAKNVSKALFRRLRLVHSSEKLTPLTERD